MIVLEVLLVVVESCAGGVSLAGVLITEAVEVVREDGRSTEEHTHTSTAQREYPESYIYTHTITIIINAVPF